MMMIYQKRGLPSLLMRIFLMVVTLGILTPIASASVVTSIRPIGFIAAAIADGVTDTQVLLPDGASPHDYALKPSDIQKLKQADLVVWVGPDLEAFLVKPLKQLKSQRKLALAEQKSVHAGLLRSEDEHEHENETAHQHEDEGEEDHHHGDYNMHIWMSPTLAKEMGISIHQRLAELLPTKKAKLDENLQKFLQELEQSELTLGKMLAPVQGKGYYVFHDAYAYFEKQFGLSNLGHFTVNPEIQPGAQRLQQIRTALVEQKAVCVFAEPQFRPAVIQAVAQGTTVRMGTLDPLGSGIVLDRKSYVTYLSQLSEQYLQCLKGD